MTKTGEKHESEVLGTGTEGTEKKVGVLEVFNKK